MQTSSHIPFIFNPQTDSQLPEDPSHSFSVLSYNILADAYTHYLSSRVSSQNLDFQQRSKLIIAELEKFNSNIICLQELDHYSDFYKAELEQLGYSIVYKQKNNRDDGSLIGFKTDLFEFISKTELNFDQGHKYESNWDFQRGTIGLVVSLKNKANGKILNVITTHLYWDAQYEHVQYLQMSETMKFISENLNDKDIIIWTGDLNSDPRSNLINFILKNSPPELAKMQYQTPENFEIMKEIFESLQNGTPPIKFSSAYSSYGEFSGSKEGGEHPDYTWYTSSYKDVIDYIFYSQENIQLVKLLKIPSHKEINGKDLPNSVYPSDHLPLLAQFYVKN